MPNGSVFKCHFNTGQLLEKRHVPGKCTTILFVHLNYDMFSLSYLPLIYQISTLSLTNAQYSLVNSKFIQNVGTAQRLGLASGQEKTQTYTTHSSKPKIANTTTMCLIQFTVSTLALKQLLFHSNIDYLLLYKVDTMTDSLWEEICFHNPMSYLHNVIMDHCQSITSEMFWKVTFLLMPESTVSRAKPL